MALVHWSPTREIDSLQKELNRLFDDTFSFSTHSNRNGMTGFTPAAELSENSDAYALKLEVPGMKADDLDIQVTTESVSISGERKSETTLKEDGLTRSEFRYGSFQRVLPMPGRIDHQNVVADYKDGILSLSLPKAEKEKNKVVKVSLN